MSELLCPFEPIDSHTSFDKKWDWVGCIVRTKTPFKNKLGIVPAGSYALVKYQWSGASVEFRPCGECEVQVTMTKIELHQIEPVCRAYENPPYLDSLYVQDRHAFWRKFDEWAFEQCGVPPTPAKMTDRAPRRQELFRAYLESWLDNGTLSLEDMLSAFEEVAHSRAREAREDLGGGRPLGGVE